MQNTNYSITEKIPPLYGLVLAGGRSKRMGQDKAQLCYHGETQLAWSFRLLSDFCEKVFVSVNSANQEDVLRRQYPQIVDESSFSGPVAGILSAISRYPNNAWMVIACDLPLLDKLHLAYLRDNRDTTKCATAYYSEHGDLPEPLCAIWEPASYLHLQLLCEKKIDCPRKILMQMSTCLLSPRNHYALRNINTPHEMIEIKNLLERMK